MLIWDLTLNIDLCYSYFTYISMEKFVKTLEASSVVSGALVCPFFIDNKFLSVLCVSLMWFWPFVADRTVIEHSETENESKDRLVSVKFQFFRCTACICCSFLPDCSSVTITMLFFFCFVLLLCW